MLNTTKQCSRCKEIKQLSEYNKLSRSKDGHKHQCRKCQADINKLDRENNPEKFRLRGLKYMESHKEHIQSYKEANKDEMKAYQKQYNIDNKEERNTKAKTRRDIPENKAKAKEYGKQYWQRNKERLYKQNRQRDLANPESTKIYKKRYKLSDKGIASTANNASIRRIRKIQASDGTIPIDYKFPLNRELQKLMTSQNKKCKNCNIDLIHGNIHLDHIKPISKGGEHSIKNVQFLCATCNLQKGTTYGPAFVV